MEQCRDRLWVESMEHAIGRCAPRVVQVLAAAGALDHADPDHLPLAGQIILEVATRACAEGWSEAELPEAAARAAQGWLMAAGLTPPPALAGHDPAAVRDAARATIGTLPADRRRVLGLLIEGFSAPEVAAALGCEVVWVEACWEETVGAVRSRLE